MQSNFANPEKLHLLSVEYRASEIHLFALLTLNSLPTAVCNGQALRLCFNRYFVTVLRCDFVFRNIDIDRSIVMGDSYSVLQGVALAHKGSGDDITVM